MPYPRTLIVISLHDKTIESLDCLCSQEYCEEVVSQCGTEKSVSQVLLSLQFSHHGRNNIFYWIVFLLLLVLVVVNDEEG